MIKRKDEKQMKEYDVLRWGVEITLKLLTERFNDYSREATETGSEAALAAKEATLTAISFLSEDLKVFIEFGTEYGDNGLGYTVIKATKRVSGDGETNEEK